MIEAALILSAMVHHWSDFWIILILLVVNVSVDFFQERKAEKALDALKKNLAPQALVLRAGKFVEIDAREIVPGDIIQMDVGDIVPADGEIIDSKTPLFNQSTITGESLPVEKKLKDEVYASSILEKGAAIIKITKTGKNTFIGKSAHLVAQAENLEESHFQKAILSIGKFLIIIASILIVVTFSYLYFAKGDSFIETLSFSLVLAIASIPVALPTVLSVTMAIGAHILAKSKAIVSNFVSLEELASVDRLAVDKTGTLTKNKISVINSKSFNNYSLEKLFIYIYFLIDRDEPSPLEKAIIKYAKDRNYFKKSVDFNLKEYTPFNPDDKFTRAIIEKDGKKIEVLMGAPQKMIAFLSKEGEEKKELERRVKKLALDGFRALIVLEKINKKYIPIGLIPLIDPPRDDSLSVVKKIKSYGIDIKMITGDNSLIAEYIGKILEIGKNVINSEKLQKIFSSKKQREKSKIILENEIFAEVTPEDKYNIVDTLQKNGHIVAMTGDGVNDAPALKKADIGIAVSGASAAARSAADLVLLSSGLGIIERAIILARETFTRMHSYALFRIAETIRIIFFVSFAVIFYGQEPLSAAMIILLALLNDIPVMAIAYDNAQASKKPVRWEIKEIIFISTILGLTGLVASFTLLWYLDSVLALPFIVIQTIIFLKMDVAGHSTLYVTRTGRKHF